MPDPAASSIAFYRERSATDVINVTFQFLRDQFGPLLKGLLFLAGPFLIGAQVLVTFAVGTQTAGAGGAPSPLVFLQFPLAVIGNVVACAVVIGAMEVYQMEGASALTTRRLWNVTRTHGMALFGRQILIGLVVGSVAALTGALFAGLAAGLGLFGGDPPITAVIIGIVGFILSLGWIFYAAPTFSLLLPGQVDTERSISLTRCVQLVKGRWGQTLGVWFLASLIGAIIFSVGRLSAFVVGALKAMGSAGSASLLVAGIFGGVANTLTPAITYTAMTFQYYNLIEQKEQVSLEAEVQRIDEEGAAAADEAFAEEGLADEVDGRDATADPESASAKESPSDAEPDDDVRWRGDKGSAPDRPT